MAPDYGGGVVHNSVIARLDDVRAAWSRCWPQAWADPQRRATMIDLHARLEVMSRVVRGDLADRPVPLPSVWQLADAIVRAELPAHDAAAGSVAPVLSSGGRRALRVERSRPAWHLSGDAGSVQWRDGVRAVLVLTVDEGDNEVVALVDVDAPGVVVDHRVAGSASVRFDDVAVPEARLVHRPDVRERLADRLTVLSLQSTLDEVAEVVDAMSSGLDADRARVELELCRAATHAAAAATARAVPPLVRRHNVSVAAVVTLSAWSAPGLEWHRERLTPLI